MAHAKPSEAEQLSNLFDLASAGLLEAAAVLSEGRRNDGSIDRQTKAFAHQCAAGACDKIAQLTKRYSQALEYAACKRGDDTFELAIMANWRFRASATNCADAAEDCGNVLGATGERIAATLKRMLERQLPDCTDTLQAQCEAASRMCKLEAAH